MIRRWRDGARFDPYPSGQGVQRHAPTRGVSPAEAIYRAHPPAPIAPRVNGSVRPT